MRKAVAGLFDRTSATYDNVGVDFFKPIARGLVSRLAPQPGEAALDIGCGRGAVLFPLADAVGPTGRVVGIDLAAGMVAATTADVAAAGDAYAHVTVRSGDAQVPDLPDEGPFDLVASSLVLFFLPDPGAAVANWRSLLKEGAGRVGITTFGPFNEEWRAVDEVFQPYLPPQMPDPRTQGAASPFASDAGVEGLFTAAGFGDVTTDHDTVPVRFENEDHWHEWTWSVGQRRMWEAVPESERAAVKATAYERLAGCRDHEGRIGFDQVVRYTLARG